jgi:hypothetical protein
MTYVEEVFEHQRWDWITSPGPEGEPHPSDEPDARNDLGGDARRGAGDPDA